MIEIRSIQDLVDNATRIRAKSRHRWLFRGHSDARWGLQPSVHRLFSGEQERNLTHEFRARAGPRHSHSPQYGHYADWLALMQHYGLPTRLLDWSHSPLTAAFFAVEHTLRHAIPRERHPSEAAIWALCPSVLNEAQGLKAYIYPLNSGDLAPLVEGAFHTVVDTLDVAAALAVESDARMQVQRGAFTVHRTVTPLDALQGCDAWLQKWHIPSDRVGSLGDEVDALGLGLADLFPDLGSLARDLTSRFMPAR